MTHRRYAPGLRGGRRLLWRKLRGKVSHVRNTAGNTWAGYARAAREAAMLTQAQLADRMDVSRQTISRWESGRFRPESANDAVKFARATGVEPFEALAAAGFRPTVEAPKEPTRAPDPELDRIRESHLSSELKKRLIAHVLQRRAREEQARMEDLEVMIRSMGG